jgi:hypothetical protein
MSAARLTFSRACLDVGRKLIWPTKYRDNSYLVKHHVVCTTEGTTPLLEYFAHCINLSQEIRHNRGDDYQKSIYTYLLTYLLVDYDVYERSRYMQTVGSGDEVFVCERCDITLSVGVTPAKLVRDGYTSRKWAY